MAHKGRFSLCIRLRFAAQGNAPLINGIVTRREAWIQLKVLSPSGAVHQVRAVIDTGFNGWLTLPGELIDDCELRLKTISRGTLADGNEAFFEVYEGRAIWDGKARRIPIHRGGSKPLLGMALLRGYKLSIDVRGRGRVEITKLTR